MKSTLLHLAAATMVAASAQAAVLFENPYDPGGFFGRSTPTQNHVPPSDSTLATYALAKVVVTGDWTINTVTVYNASGSGFDPLDPAVGLLQAHLHVVADADLAGFDPTSMVDVYPAAVTVITPGSPLASGTTSTAVTVPGGMALAAGTYWIGVTAAFDNITPLAALGQGIGSVAPEGPSELAHYTVEPANITSTTASTYGVWETVASPLAITIEGVPEPASITLVGLGAIALLRRRRN